MKKKLILAIASLSLAIGAYAQSGNQQNNKNNDHGTGRKDYLGRPAEGRKELDRVMKEMDEEHQPPKTTPKPSPTPTPSQTPPTGSTPPNNKSKTASQQ